MTDVALVILFTLAIAIGFYLGSRTQKNKRISHNQFSPDKSYFQGLNLLLNEEPDKAVEEFVRLLDVNSYTLETHLALGKLMRKQGQVDRAIRIHQNLLARPQLEISDQHQVHLELARDFMAAGLLDRAETLLQEVIAESAVLRSIAQRYLLDIYQDESEWQDAIVVAQSLLQSKYMKANTEAKREVSRMIAHFYCQLAEENKANNDIAVASKYLDLASSADKTVLRVPLLYAVNENVLGRHKQVIKGLSKLEAQSPAWFASSLPILFDSYLKLNSEQGFDQFITQLENHIEQYKSTSAVVFLVDRLLERVESKPEYYGKAKEILTRYVTQHASLTASNKLIEIRLDSKTEDLPDDVKNLHAQVAGLLNKRNLFRCGDCGFSGRQLHWRCPSCKHWDSIHRLEDEQVYT